MQVELPPGGEFWEAVGGVPGMGHKHTALAPILPMHRGGLMRISLQGLGRLTTGSATKVEIPQIGGLEV